MPTWSRAVHSSLCLVAVAALAQPSVVALAGPRDAAAPSPSATSPAAPTTTSTPTSTPTSPAPSDGPVRSISYHGILLEAPSTWPVIDLNATPHACVRLDRSAVYLGDPSAQQDCPAHLVGRADTIWLHGVTPFRGPAFAARSAKVGALAAQVATDPVGHGTQVHFAHQNVQVDASWGADSRAVDAVLATASLTTSPTTTAPSPSPSTSTSTPSSTSSSVPTSPSASSATPAALVSTTTSASSTFTGMAFDTCAAPTSSTMSSWLASPYRTLGIYIGGSMRACGDGNLSASWVSTVKSMGWGLAPIYVGPQAPCVDQSGLATITPSQAAAQGKSNADDAVSRATYFGMGAGTPIYYDMEAYNTAVAGCSATVMTFISAWSSELKARGYTPGAYGSTDSLMTDMAKSMGTSGFVPPADIWFADWNGLQTTTDSGFSSAYWTDRQRLHQYSGGVNQTWGGATINIDANWSDALVAGVAVPVDYGTNVVGPGSPGFVFTGNMSYWRPNAPQGLKGRAYWTYSSGGSEYNGATWSPQLVPGVYSVQAYIPGTGGTAAAPYTVRYAGGSTVKVVNQQPLSGYTSLGTYLASSSTSISVHVGDNDGTTTTTQLGVDAMAFRRIAAAHDWNGDAHNDVLARDSSGNLLLYPGNGTGGWLTATRVGAGWNGMTAIVAVGDFDGDGFPDLLARDGSGNLWLYSGNGTGGWLAAKKIGAGWGGMTAITSPGDFNGDGHPDVLARDGSGNLWLYPGNGTGGWLAATRVGAGWKGMTAITSPGDFNGDGHPDVLARDGSGNLWLYPGNGTGGWLSATRVGAGWKGMTAITSPGDFNGDGHPDVLARDGSGNLWLYPGNGTGGWLTPTRVGAGWNGMTALS